MIARLTLLGLMVAALAGAGGGPAETATDQITLKDGSWVGARATICPGVELAENAIAALGSVVTQSIPRNEIHSGDPAQFLRRRPI